MLTRLKVSGFKNLVDVDVRFGPFTCIAGANGVGKSNLFDAIEFLSALADRPMIEAAKSVRDEGARAGDIRSLFHRAGETYSDHMSFEAEMIIPREGHDDLGQAAEASITFLRYEVVLAYRENESGPASGGLELIKEELNHIKLGEAAQHLLFPNASSWRKSVVTGRRTIPLISTELDGQNRVIKLHQDGKAGRPISRRASHLPRTALSAVNAAESPTALLARREMQSWRLLQLEPTALRKPDEFAAPTRLGPDGSHLPATLYHLARTNGRPGAGGRRVEQERQVYARVANRLAELIEDVREIWVDRDERRGLLTLCVADREKTSHPARALSDGTLRFMALAVLELDPDAKGLLCLEEPENGIHPERIPAMLALLQAIATDTDHPVGLDNPLRQVIVNTHSPSVVSQVPDDCLLVAESKDAVRDGRRFKRVCFSPLPETWRDRRGTDNDATDVVSKGKLLAYLNPIAITDPESPAEPDDMPTSRSGRRRRRVVDRPDLRQLVFPWVERQQD